MLLQLLGSNSFSEIAHFFLAIPNKNFNTQVNGILGIQSRKQGKTIFIFLNLSQFS